MAKTWLEMFADEPAPKSFTTEQIWKLACKATLKSISETFLKAGEVGIPIAKTDLRTMQILGELIEGYPIPEFPDQLK